jgi:dihydrolipoamide dehydrogenase
MTTYDLVVIGAGPGGYVCAIRAAQLGLRVACVEKDPALGGACLNVGCIPSKALLESTERLDAITHQAAEHGIVVEGVRADLAALMRRKNGIVAKLTGGIAGLFKKNGVRWVKGTGRVQAADRVAVTGPEGEEELATKAIVIATGSSVAPLRGAPFDGDRIVSSTEALAFPAVPAHLVVVGAGVIGLELGSVWRRLGSRVTVLEYLDRILPGADLELASDAQKTLTAQGFQFVLGARVLAAQAEGAVGERSVVVTWSRRGGASEELRADRVLVAIGRLPHTEGLGCAEAGILLDKRGRVEVDAHLETRLRGVYAIGDVIAGPMLAHKAEDEGIMVAERLAGGAGHVTYEAIPSIVYTHPEIAWVGDTEETLTEKGTPYRVGRFRFAANGRAMALGETQGWVKILAHAESDRLLGAHILGARAGDLVAELAVAMEFKASAEDIARSVHAHPTLAEIVREAALDVGRRALHK